MFAVGDRIYLPDMKRWGKVIGIIVNRENKPAYRCQMDDGWKCTFRGSDLMSEKDAHLLSVYGKLP